MDREIDLDERRRTQLKRGGLGLAVIIVVIGTIVATLSWLRPTVDRAEILTAKVERGDLQLSLDAGGTVVPAYEKVISSPVDTRVVRILRRPGETLKPGDEIIALDTSSTRLEMDRLEERLGQKRGERTRAILDSRDRVSDLEGQIEAKTLDEEILRYKASQAKTLFDQGLVSEEALKQAEVELRKAGIELGQLRSSLEGERRRSESKIEALESEISIIEKERGASAEQLSLASARADQAGVLTWILQQEGATVRKGEVIARIADLTSYRVEATISDIHASKFSPGTAAGVVIGPEVLRGTVSSIDPTITNGTIRFFVDLNDPSNEALRNNLRVDVYIVTGERQDVLRVRKGRFLTGSESQDVFVIRDDTAIRTQARFGFSGREFIEVLEGLGEGDEIIISDTSDYDHISQMKVK